MATQATTQNLMGSVPLMENPIYKHLTEAFDAIMLRNVEEPLGQMASVRFLKDNYDREILKRTCRMLGYDISQDVLNLQTDLTKLTTQLPLYADYNGTHLFEKFIELLLNGECEVEHLYAKVYPQDPDFYYDWSVDKPAEADMVVNGGDWIETTHIDLYIGLLSTAISFDSIVLRPGQTLYERVQEIFFDYAPAPLVVRHFWFLAKVEFLLRIGAVVPTEGRNVWITLFTEPTVIADGATPSVSSIDMLERARELFSSDLLASQTKTLDVLGFPLAQAACNAAAIDVGASPITGPDLPHFVPTVNMHNKVNQRRALTLVGHVSIEKDKSTYTVEFNSDGFTVFGDFYVYVLDWNQQSILLRVVCACPYSQNGVALQAPSYFVEEKHITAISNFRLMVNEPIIYSGVS